MPVYMAAISLKKLCGWLFLYFGKKTKRYYMTYRLSNKPAGPENSSGKYPEHTNRHLYGKPLKNFPDLTVPKVPVMPRILFVPGNIGSILF